MSLVNLEAIAIVFHVGSSIKSKSSELSSFVAEARNCIFKILLRKIFSESKDVLCVIVAGCEETENELSDGEQYQNIKLLSKFTIANWGLLEAVSVIQESEINVNWLDAVIVGIHCLRDKIEEIESYKKLKKNITKKKLVLLSSFIDDVPDDQVDAVVEGLKDNEIELVVIGPDILKLEENGDSSTLLDIEKLLTKSQQLILKIYNEIAEKGTLCSCNDALEQLKYFKNRRTKRMPWNAKMSIGPDIAIHISGFKMLTDTQQPIKWKLCTFNNGPVKSDNSYFLGEDEVNREDIICGYLFGSTIVPFSADDEDALKYHSGEQGLSVLFTVPSDEIPKHLFMGESPYLIVGHKTDKAAQTAITAIAKALDETNTVAVARKVYRYDSSVHIGALFPRVDTLPYGLLFIEIPFNNEIKKLKFPTLSNVSVNDEQLSAVDKLIDDMDLSNFEDEDDDPYNPESLHDPYEQYINHCILMRGFQGEEKSFNNEAMEIPEFIQSLTLPIPEITKKSKHSLKKIKGLFNLKVIEQKRSVKTEKDDSTVKEEIDHNLEEEKNSLNNENITDFFLPAVSTVGTVNPESDFTTLLAKGEQFQKVINQLQQVIVALLRRADDLDMLNKPLSCTTLLRKSCLEKKRTEDYNNWMMKLKDIVIDIRQQDFWDKIVQGNLGLITTDEENTSVISRETADEFLHCDTNLKQEVKYEEMDIEAMLDEI